MGMDECKELISVKQKLLDSLAEESTMVISTAYAYAKNYVKYGEDITKAWTTAVQQASIIEKVSLNAWAQAHETFRREYENRLKADLVDMLTEIQLEIEEIKPLKPTDDEDWQYGCFHGLELMQDKCLKLIQQKINSLKED
jgi:predicted nucleic acid-binding protein